VPENKPCHGQKAPSLQRVESVGLCQMKSNRITYKFFNVLHTSVVEVSSTNFFIAENQVFSPFLLVGPAFFPFISMIQIHLEL
jgi:hypothetical protein